MSSALSIDLASEFSIDSIAKLSSLSSGIFDLKKVLIYLSLENDLSAVATVTGTVTNRTSNFYASGKDELTLLSSTKPTISKTDVLSAISFLNSLANDVNSVSKFSVKSSGLQLHRLQQSPVQTTHTLPMIWGKET